MERFYRSRDNVLYYLRINKEKPKFDKYDYTEKAEYWALIWGTIVMGFTGFVLWFPTIVGNWAPEWFIKVSEIIHFYEAIFSVVSNCCMALVLCYFSSWRVSNELNVDCWKMSLHKYRHHHEKHFRRVVLEWKEFKSGVRNIKKVSNSTKLFTSTLEKNGLDPNSIIQHEIDNDPELRVWLEEKLQTKEKEKKKFNKESSLKSNFIIKSLKPPRFCIATTTWQNLGGLVCSLDTSKKGVREAPVL